MYESNTLSISKFFHSSQNTAHLKYINEHLKYVSFIFVYLSGYNYCENNSTVEKIE